MPNLTVGIYTELKHASTNWHDLINKTLSAEDNNQAQNALFAAICKWCEDNPKQSLCMHLSVAQLVLFAYANLKNNTTDLNKLKKSLLDVIQLLAKTSPQIVRYSDSERITLVDLAFYYAFDDLVLWLLQNGAPQKPDRLDPSIIMQDSWRQIMSFDPFKISEKRSDIIDCLKKIDQKFAEYIKQLKAYVKFTDELLRITEQTATANPFTLLAGKPQLVYRVVDYLDLKPILKPIRKPHVQTRLDPYHTPHFSDRYRPQYRPPPPSTAQIIRELDQLDMRGWLPFARIEDQPPPKQAKPTTPKP